MVTSLIPPSPADLLAVAVAPPRLHQLSESASLFPSAVFSAAFHF